MARSYKRRKKRGSGLRARYNAYKDAYKVQEKKLAKEGLEMNVPLYDKGTWVEQWLKTRNTLKEEKDKGARKSIGNVNQYIVRQQAYPVSYKQSEATIRAWRESGRLDTILGKNGGSKVDFRQFQTRLRAGKLKELDKWYDFLGDEYVRLTTVEGMNANEAKKAISQTYYGSK